jgi:hypothetical protein
MNLSRVLLTSYDTGHGSVNETALFLTGVADSLISLLTTRAQTQIRFPKLCILFGTSIKIMDNVQEHSKSLIPKNIK